MPLPERALGNEDSTFRTTFTERVCVDWSDGLGLAAPILRTSSVASFSLASPRKTYWYQDFFSFFPSRCSLNKYGAVLETSLPAWDLSDG